jgi:hypothetical protein
MCLSLSSSLVYFLFIFNFSLFTFTKQGIEDKPKERITTDVVTINIYVHEKGYIAFRCKL